MPRIDLLALSQLDSIRFDLGGVALYNRRLVVVFHLPGVTLLTTRPALPIYTDLGPAMLQTKSATKLIGFEANAGINYTKTLETSCVIETTGHEIVDVFSFNLRNRFVNASCPNSHPGW